MILFAYLVTLLILYAMIYLDREKSLVIYIYRSSHPLYGNYVLLDDHFWERTDQFSLLKIHFIIIYIFTCFGVFFFVPACVPMTVFAPMMNKIVAA